MAITIKVCMRFVMLIPAIFPAYTFASSGAVNVAYPSCPYSSCAYWDDAESADLFFCGGKSAGRSEFSGETLATNINTSALRHSVEKIDMLKEPYSDAATGTGMSAFAQLTYPKGIYVDHGGNVYVSSLSLFDGGLYKFAPNGALLAYNGSLFGEFRFVFDEGNNVMWALETNGIIYLVDPNTLYAQPFINVNQFIDPQAPVLSVNDGHYYSLFMIDPQYGDITFSHVNENGFDVFITGLTMEGGNPFVFRFRFDFTQGVQNPDIVLTSFPYPTPIVPPPFDTQPPGIAANDDGSILTTMLNDIYGSYTPYYLVSFATDCPDGDICFPGFVPETYGQQVVSFGMTHLSPNGGFYFVTSANGLGCGAGPAVVHMTESHDAYSCIADLSFLALGTMGPADIAVDSVTGLLYVTMTANNLVLRLECGLGVGDTDNDFDVDGFDLLRFSEFFSATDPRADLNRNNIQDQEDLAIFAGVFGQQRP